MYVCLCSGVTTDMIVKESNKCTNYKTVIKNTGCCKQCGCCKDEIKRIFNETKSCNDLRLF